MNRSEDPQGLPNTVEAAPRREQAPLQPHAGPHLQ